VNALTLVATANPHAGAVLPIARVVVLMVPVAAMCFYVFVIRTKKK
jgi:hypothetical protein